MSMSLEAAAQVMREAMRETVKRHSLWYLIQGGLMVLAGILALVFPAISSVAVVVFLGWLLIFSGILQAISLIGARHVPHFWLQLVSVVLFILVGSLFLRNPGEGLLTLTLLLIVFFMVEGISKVIFALTIRPFPNWGWVLGSGIVGILLAFYLWASIPVSAVWLLGVLLGIELICEGAALTSSRLAGAQELSRHFAGGRAPSLSMRGRGLPPSLSATITTISPGRGAPGTPTVMVSMWSNTQTSSRSDSGTSIATPAAATLTFEGMIALPPPIASRIGLPMRGCRMAAACSMSPSSPTMAALP